MLTTPQIEIAAKQWRDAWTNILNHQLLAVECFYTIYKPLGASGFGGRVPVETDPAALERCQTLQDAFSELKSDMMEEVNDIEKKLMIPAKLARDALKPMHKTIKKREERKVRARPPSQLTLLLLMLCLRLTTNATRAVVRHCKIRRAVPTETMQH